MKAIPLTRGKVALVDDEDYEFLSQFKWQASGGYMDKIGKYYATRSAAVKGVDRDRFMHRVILEPPKGMFVDHIDGNGLNNQKSNIRICTSSQNNAYKPNPKNSTSRYKCVSWCNTVKKWRVKFKINKKTKHIGHFDTELEAGIIANILIRRYHGEFAVTTTHYDQ